MTQPPPRKRFQLHLSTAIVMMFVAGALMWLNIGKEGKFIVEAPGSNKPPFVQNREVTRIYGWPFQQEFMTEEENIRYNGFGDWVIGPEIRWLLDAIINLTILFAAYFLCEWLIRRGPARKGA